MYVLGQDHAEHLDGRDEAHGHVMLHSCAYEHGKPSADYPVYFIPSVVTKKSFFLVEI